MSEDHRDETDEPADRTAQFGPTGSLTGLAPSSTYKILGEKAAADGTAVLGHNTATSGTAHGVEGVTDSANGGPAGLYGEATAGSGATTGVEGLTRSPGGDYTTPTGVRGRAANATSLPSGAFGVAGNSDGGGFLSSFGFPVYAGGVFGRSNASDGTYTAGVYGVNSNMHDGAAGVRGKASTGSGATYGVEGVTLSADSDAAGVRGEATAGSGTIYGVEGVTNSGDSTAAAVRADAPDGATGVDVSTGSGTGIEVTSNTGVAVAAKAGSVRGGDVRTDDGGRAALWGENNATRNVDSAGYGVVGRTGAVGPNAAGVRGVATETSGVTYGVTGSTFSEAADAAGVSAYAQAGNADALRAVASGAGHGVRAITDDDDSYAVYATNQNTASAFAGAVLGVAESGDAAAIVGQNSVDGGTALRGRGRLQVFDSVSGSDSNPDVHVAELRNTTSNTAQGLAVRFPNKGTSPDGTNNFVSFRAGGSGVGTIEGNGSGGVAYATSGADYAEFLPAADPAEAFEAGDVVGVVDGTVTRDTADAARVLVVTGEPAVTGNAPAGPGSRADHATVAFTGQVPVKVRGPVADGDLVVPSGEGDGTARAVAPGEWRPGTPVVGQAWEGCDDGGVTEVTVAVGVDDPGVVGPAMADRRDRIRELEAENEALRERNEALEARLDAVESELGLGGGADRPGVADD